MLRSLSISIPTLLIIKINKFPDLCNDSLYIIDLRQKIIEKTHLLIELNILIMLRSIHIDLLFYKRF